MKKIFYSIFLVAFIVLGFNANSAIFVDAASFTQGPACTGIVTCSGIIASVSLDGNSLIHIDGNGSCTSSDPACSCTGTLSCLMTTYDDPNATCTCNGANYTVTMVGSSISCVGGDPVTGVGANCSGTGSGITSLCGNGSCEYPESVSSCSQDCPVVSGDTGPPGSGGSGLGSSVPLGNSTLSVNGLIDTLLNFIWPLFMGFAVFMFLLAGFQFLTAQGDPGKVDSARQFVLWGVVGVTMGVLAFSLPFIVRTTLDLG